MERSKSGQANPEAKKTMEEIQKKLGFIPQFVHLLPEQALVGAWEEAKQLYFSTNTSLSPKLKNLIVLGVGSAMPCEYTIYAERELARANGASEQEEKEAINIAAIVRHWSAVLNGIQQDDVGFKKEVRQMLKKVWRTSTESQATQEEWSKNFLSRVSNVEEAYQDIDRVFGLVPEFLRKFPVEAVAGAWMEMKWIQFNPDSAIPKRDRELIAVAVASQIPCHYCTFFHKEAGLLHGATERNLIEAVALAGWARHRSTVLSGSGIDQAAYQKDVQKIVESLGKQRAA